MGAQDPRDLTHSSREPVCACIILDLMQPALPTLITASLFPPFFFLFVFHPFALLPLLLLPSSLCRERSGKGSPSLSIPTLVQMPERCLAVPLASYRPQGRVTLVRFAARIRTETKGRGDSVRRVRSGRSRRQVAGEKEKEIGREEKRGFSRGTVL